MYIHTVCHRAQISDIDIATLKFFYYNVALTFITNNNNNNLQIFGLAFIILHLSLAVIFTNSFIVLSHCHTMLLLVTLLTSLHTAQLFDDKNMTSNATNLRFKHVQKYLWKVNAADRKKH